jgi:hypothetical protein
MIKEGRKFGVFLTLASQRPSDISPTIISQLHNYFLHRLINNEDIRAVEKTISYLDRVSFEYLPILPTGTCIFAGCWRMSQLWLISKRWTAGRRVTTGKPTRMKVSPLAESRLTPRPTRQTRACLWQAGSKRERREIPRLRSCLRQALSPRLRLSSLHLRQ